MAKCKIDKCPSYAVKEKLCAKHFIYKNATVKKHQEKLKKYPWQGLYYTNTWKKLRILHLSSNPLCNSCGNPGNEVDHIVDHKGNRDLFYDLENLQTLCKKCHAKKTFEDSRYFGLPKSEIYTVTINLVDESECQLLKYKNTLNLENISDYIYKLLAKREDKNFMLSKKAYIIRLYKIISLEQNQKPKLKSNSMDILKILSEE